MCNTKTPAKTFVIQPDADDTILRYSSKLIEFIGPAMQEFELNDPTLDIMSEVMTKGITIKVLPMMACNHDTDKEEEECECTCDGSKCVFPDDGVKIKGVTISGMTPEEFVKRIDAILAKLGD